MISVTSEEVWLAANRNMAASRPVALSIKTECAIYTNSSIQAKKTAHTNTTSTDNNANALINRLNLGFMPIAYALPAPCGTPIIGYYHSVKKLG